MGLLNNLKEKGKNKIKRKVIAAAVPLAIKGIALLLVIAIITSIVEWVIKVFQPQNTVDQIYKNLEIEDVSDLIQIKGNNNDGYYLDFADDVDDKLDDTIDYLNRTAGVKSGIDKDFLKKMIKAEVCTQFPDLGANVEDNKGFQGIIDILRITPNKEIGELKNTGAGQETIKDDDDLNKTDINNKDVINKQEKIVKKWNKGKELTLAAKAFVYSQEDSILHPGEKIDYWTPQKNEKTQNNLEIRKNEKVTYTGEYSISINKMTNEGLIYIGIEKDDIKGYIKYNFIVKDSEDENITDEELVDTGYSETTEEKVTDTIDSNVYKLTYIPKEEFDKNIEDANKDVLYHFTIDDDGNLITAKWSLLEDGTLEVQTNSAINLKSALQNYIIPYAYLMYFYMEADYKDFSSDLADKVFDSKIIIALEDNVTTTKVVETIETKKVSKNSSDWTAGTPTETLTEYCSTKIEIIYADTWCAKLIDKGIYKSDLLNVSVGQPKNIKMPGTVTDTTTHKISKERQTGTGTDTITHEEKDEEGNTKYAWSESFSYTMYERTITDTHSISNSYSNGDKEIKSKENVFVDLYKEHQMNNRMNDKRFLYILEEDERTANLVNLTKYLMYMATNIDYGVKEYDFSEYAKNNFISAGSLGGSLSLTTPTLDKETFVEALREYANNGAPSAFKTNFLPYVDNIYDWSVAAGVNPELVIITAKSEGKFGETGGSYNYWGIGVSNGSETGNSYSSLKEGIEGYAQVIISYQTGWKKDSINDKAIKRAAVGVDPLGYGTPETLSGMQSLYSSLGEHVTGSSGTGGYYYMDPSIANVTKIYSTHAEFLTKCKNSGLSEHAYGTSVTEWENGQYTAWQVEQKLTTWEHIFGNFGSLPGSGSTEIVETAKSKLGCPYVLGAKGPDSFDCSGFVYWVYKQKGITVPGSTDEYKSYINSGKEIDWSQAQPGDILIIFNTERGTTYGHAGIYLGNDEYIHAPQTGDVVKISSGAQAKFRHVFRFN